MEPVPGFKNSMKEFDEFFRRCFCTRFWVTGYGFWSRSSWVCIVRGRGHMVGQGGASFWFNPNWPWTCCKVLRDGQYKRSCAERGEATMTSLQLVWRCACGVCQLRCSFTGPATNTVA